jgi:MFS family permease
MNDLVSDFHLSPNSLGHLTSAVQFGFIIGTLVFALLTIADRYSPSKVFMLSALLASLFNLGTILSFNTFPSLFAFRFFTGFFLAGIYPVGMKIAADYYDKGLGKSLGFLVGALVVGTAFPHLIKGFSEGQPWRNILIFTSSIAVLGGLLIQLFVPDGPFRIRSHRPDFKAIFLVFNNRSFRAAAFGYFGHMWELYAFWTFVPILLITYTSFHPDSDLNIPLLSFFIIGVGGLGCIVSGYLSQKFGTRNTAAVALALSGICCLISPLIILWSSPTILITFLLFWGIMVVADSPLFSTLVAQSTKAETKATALTIVNSIGFAFSIISIQLLNVLQSTLKPAFIYLVLAIGPIFGIMAFLSSEKKMEKFS